MKGIALPVEYLIILIIALVVLIVIVLYFGLGWDIFWEIRKSQALNKACEVLRANQCMPGAQSFEVPGVDLNKDGVNDTIAYICEINGLKGNAYQECYKYCKCPLPTA